MILTEQDLVFQLDIENKVCPILLALSDPDSDDEYKAEAVSVSPSREGQPTPWWTAPELGECTTQVSAELHVGRTVLINKVAGDSAPVTGGSQFRPEHVLKVMIQFTSCKKATLGKSVT